MDKNNHQEQPLSLSEIAFLTCSMGSVLASVHFLLSAAL